MEVRIAIVGYGNLGKGVELALQKCDDLKLVGIFSRRDPSTIQSITNANVYTMDTLMMMKDKIDVVVLCGGSATDLPKQSVELAKHFNLVDSFDNHSQILNHIHAVNQSSVDAKRVSVVACGWDPGLFSIQRLVAQAVLPQGTTYTFWGKGISQGHSDAIRRIEGVADAKQYTIPKEEAIMKVKSGSNPELSVRDKHLRECFVVLKEGADANAIKVQIETMPAYFADYDTTVHFVSQTELDTKHGGIPHGGVVMHSASTGADGTNKQLIEYALHLDSNPEFTASVLVAYARAAARLFKDKAFGCKTVYDIPLAYLHPKQRDEIIKELM